MQRTQRLNAEGAKELPLCVSAKTSASFALKSVANSIQLQHTIEAVRISNRVV